MGDVSRLNYLYTLLKFAFRENPLLHLGVAVSVLSVIIEIAAMSTLLPLASVAAGQPLPEKSLIVRAATQIGFVPDGRALLLMFIVLFGLRILTQFAGEGLIQLLSKRMLAQLATRAFASLVRTVPMKEVERTSIGAYITLVGDESFRASILVVHLSQFLTLAMLGVLYYAAVFTYSPAVGISVLVFMAVSFLAMFESFRVSHRLGIRQVEQSQAAGSLFLDALNGLRSVRAFSAEDYVAASYRAQMWQYIRTLFSIDLISLLTRLGPALLLLAAVAAIAAWPAVGDKLAMDFPVVVTIIILLLRFFPVVGQALSVALRVIADARAGRDVTSLVRDYEVNAVAGEGREHLTNQIERIEAIGVRFCHAADKLVLVDFNLVLERGKSYGLVGLSGSGKSTFLDLLMGFYPLDEGWLLVNGEQINQISLGELRKKILLVSQDTTIFNDTVINNVRFGGEATQQEIQRACRIACIHDFIIGLPKGYDTGLSYQGSNLSGGQKQRIGIARAVLRHPDVLLLDESTSALDSDTREQLVRNLQEEFADRILLFVTHDAFVTSRVNEVFDMAAINRGAPQQVGSSTGSGAS